MGNVNSKNVLWKLLTTYKKPFIQKNTTFNATQYIKILLLTVVIREHCMYFNTKSNLQSHLNSWLTSFAFHG